MKTLFNKQYLSSAALGMGLLLAQSALGQAELKVTGVLQTDEQAIRLNWASQSNKVYQIQCADTLVGNEDGSTAWQTLYDQYPSHGTNTFWLDTGNYNLAPAVPHPKNMAMRFYRIADLGADTISDKPNISILSPTNGNLVTGELIITVAASTDQPVLSGTKLYVDGQEMRMADTTTNYNDGATNYLIDTYSINTCEWGNGTHTLFATAENQSDYGDAMNAPPVASGHTVSDFVPVTFSNLVTRISFSQPIFDPSSGQTQKVSAVFAANSDWTLTIRDVYSNAVHTVTGSGDYLQYNWDGNGDGGSNLPPGIYYYYISAQTNGQSSMSMMGGSSFLRSDSAFVQASEQIPQLWAIPSESSGSPVPLAIYPPGMNTNDFTIFEATQSEVQALIRAVMPMEKPSILAARASNGSSYIQPNAASGGSSAPSQNAPSAPHRPPNNPVRGLAGSFAIAYQNYTGNGVNGYHLNAPANRPYFQAIKIEDSTGGTFAPRPRHKLEADNFVSEMQHWGWSKGFVKADNELQLSDMQGSGTPFNQVNLGVFLGHGTYGTTADYYASGCKQMYFPITSGTSAQWLRMSEMNLGGAGTSGLKWMALKTCNSLNQIDWEDMQYYEVYPYNNNLHLLLGSATDSATSATLLALWAKYMSFGTSTNYNPMTVRAAWYKAAQDAYKGVKFPPGTVMKFVVAGNDACFDDLLQTNNPPTGSWIYDTPVTVFSN